MVLFIPDLGAVVGSPRQVLLTNRSQVDMKAATAAGVKLLLRPMFLRNTCRLPGEHVTKQVPDTLPCYHIGAWTAFCTDNGPAIMGSFGANFTKCVYNELCT